MHARPIPIVSVAFIALSLLAALSVGPVGAAGPCALKAPVSVRVGDPLEIVGSGFPAATAVDVSFVVDGRQRDAFTVQSNTAGGFKVSLTPEAADAGVTTVTAKTGSACSAKVTFTVIGSNGPAPTPAQTAAPGGAAAGPSPNPTAAPRTDTIAQPTSAPGRGLSSSWALAMVCLALGIGSLVADRRRRTA